MRQEINETGTTNYLSSEEVEALRVSYPFTIHYMSNLPDTLQPDGSLTIIYRSDPDSRMNQRFLDVMIGVAGLPVEEVKSSSEPPIG